ncbi:MAG: ribulose-phosphate 3-epimerase, partial [Candidatus Sumerlaeia bacterium]|nr:ribulose-phosphate 3-epimerase [Candidatus Sumerlaeia bacterium]
MEQKSEQKKRGYLSPPPNKAGIIIAPSLLSANFSNLAAEVRKVIRAGCQWLHFDVMDGHFVPNLTFGPLVVAALRPLAKKLFFDVHLMIEEPQLFAPQFVAAGAQAITFHQEIDYNIDQLIRLLRRNNVKVGISLRPKTPLEAIEPYLSRVDLVLVMSVEPGFGGQKLIPRMLNKVRQLRLLKETKRLKFLIQIDGGINAETA